MLRENGQRSLTKSQGPLLSVFLRVTLDHIPTGSTCRARRLVTMPFVPIKKLGRSISNSRLASAFFFSAETPAQAEPSRTRTTDTIPEESVICNVDASSEAQASSPGLQRSGSSLLRRLSLKPLRLKRRSSSAEKQPQQAAMPPVAEST